MTRVQKAQLRQSELKTEIAAELDKENEQREEGRLERLTREAQAVEVELRADLTIEAEAAIPDCIDTPEGRELRRRNSIYDRGCGTRGWQYGESTSQLFSGGAVVSAIGVEMSWSDWMKTSMNGMVSFLESLIVGQGREAGRRLQLLNGLAFHQKARRRLPASQYRTLPYLSRKV